MIRHIVLIKARPEVTETHIAAIFADLHRLELPGTLAGPLRRQGQIKNQQLQLNAELDVTGKLALLQESESVSFGFDPTHLAVRTKPESDARCNMFNVPVTDQAPDLFGLPEIKIALTDAVHADAFAIPLPLTNATPTFY